MTQECILLFLQIFGLIVIIFWSFEIGKSVGRNKLYDELEERKKLKEELREEIE